MKETALAVTEQELRDAHRDLALPLTYEAIVTSPALLICLRNLAEIRARRKACVTVDCKRAAAHDRD